MDWLARKLAQHRFAIWLVVAAITVVLWQVNRPVQFDQSIEGFFPPDHPAVVNYARAKQAFGGDDFVFVAYDDPELWTAAGMARLRELTGLIRQQVTGIARIDSLDQMPLPWKVDAAVETLLGLPPLRRPLALPGLVAALATVATEVQANQARPESIEALRSRLVAHPLFRNWIVDPQGQSTALVVRLNPPDRVDQTQAVTGLRRVVDEFGSANSIDHIAVAGPPVLLADGFMSLERDNRRLGAVAMGLMALAMLIAVRSPWWAILPLVSGGATWLLTEAFLNWFDLRLSLSAGPIIAQTVVLCMPAASHLAMHFQESARVYRDRTEAVRHTLMAVAVPVAWCSLTAAAGYLALLSSTVRPVLQFGVTMALCNVLAGALAYALAPGAMQPPALRRRTGDSEVFTEPDRSSHIGLLTAWVLKHPKTTLFSFVVPSVLIALGIARMQFQSNYIRVFRSDSRVATDYRFIESRMGGIGLVELDLPGPQDSKGVSAQWLDQLHSMSDSVRLAHPDLVAEAVSLSDVLSRTEKTATEATDAANAEDVGQSAQRPKRGGFLGGLVGRSNVAAATPEQIIQAKLLVLGTPIFAHYINNFWDRRSGQARIVVRIRESVDADTKQRVLEQILSEAHSQLSEECRVSGLSHLMTQVTRALITTQFQSTAWSCAVILTMLILALRSAWLGVLALVPTLLSVALVLGTMGWLGIRIDMSTALVASVATGLSVDDTFHCLLRWKRELRHGRAPDEALRISYAGAGPGVILSSAAVSIGFLALIFSEFVPTANFGWLVAVATLGGSMGNLILLPACLRIFTRGTATPNQSTRCAATD